MPPRTTLLGGDYRRPTSPRLARDDGTAGAATHSEFDAAASEGVDG